MVLNPILMTATGGLILLLVSASCASKSPTRTADASPRDRVVASDERTAMTERPVPSNRTGFGDPTATDRTVPCADATGDMTASSDCTPAGGRHADRDLRSADTAAMANCAYHTDDRGRIVYDDPDCAKRYGNQMGSSYQNVRWTQESAFYDRHVSKASQHAREAELAANQGRQAEMRRHAELALDQAKEAQRAGNVTELNAGIQNLRDALRSGDGAGITDPARSIHEARMNLARAGGMKVPADTRVPGAAAATARTMPRSVKGEVVSSETVTSDGSRRFLLREPNGRETPIVLSPDMTTQLRSGDMIEAQVDSQGRVAAINKSSD